jgi:nitrite reductase/ring-hydroxylating ferredoxin subunit
MLNVIFKRIAFARKYNTWKPVTLAPGSGKRIVVFHKGREVELPRRCPHQGAPLETGRVRGGKLQCPWHGCYYDLESGNFCAKTFTPEGERQC